ncbi:hypothetical protein [Alkalihalobacillus deserti]|uniref:hypothetical protein n=1 Tax=Alkalihalobacillus deserti TaxID=2879466 RepID=UPI001D134693|nr:hypothetical protein [Alkalihalobacillus deserti]
MIKKLVSSLTIVVLLASGTQAFAKEGNNGNKNGWNNPKNPHYEAPVVTLPAEVAPVETLPAPVEIDMLSPIFADVKSYLDGKIGFDSHASIVGLNTLSVPVQYSNWVIVQYYQTSINEALAHDLRIIDVEHQNIHTDGGITKYADMIVTIGR